MNYTEKLSYLESYYEILDTETDLYDQIKSLQESSTIHGMQITDGIHSNDVHSAVELASIRITDLQDRYNKTVSERKIIRNRIESAAYAMRNKRLAALILNKYINLWSDQALRRWMQVGKTGLSQCMKNGVTNMELEC